MIGGLRITARQARIALDLATALVVASVAVALAGLTWRIAGHAGTGAITIPSAGRAGPALAPDIAPALALAPFGKPAAGDATQATALALVLKGVIAADPASLSTAFIAVDGAEPAAFHIGDTVSGATIQGILRDRVVLNNGGRTEYLAFPDPTLSIEARQAAAAQSPAQPGAAPAAPVGGAAAPPAPAAPSPAALLQRLDASPVDGGLRIGANGPPGLMPGDVIQSVNGSPLSDPATAGAALQAAQASGSAQITLVRNGQRITLTVPLR